MGEYLSFVNTPGGRVHRELSPRKRKLNTLFGRFLDTGEKGLLQGKLFVFELIGLLISPFIISLYSIEYIYNTIIHYMWNKIELCAFPESRLSGEALLLSDNIKSELSNMGIVAPNNINEVCKLLIQSEVEGSEVANILSIFDIMQYSAVASMYDIWSEYLVTPIYLWEIVHRAPKMYYDYYISDRSSVLPPRRQACLLRYGIDAAREEMQRLATSIAAQELIIQETQSKRYLTLSNTAIILPPRTSYVNKYKKGVQQRGTTTDSDIKIAVDLGPDGSWESLLNTCLIQRFQEHEYEFCFFGQITQDNTHSLGRFAHWGKRTSCYWFVSDLLSFYCNIMLFFMLIL